MCVLQTGLSRVFLALKAPFFKKSGTDLPWVVCGIHLTRLFFFFKVYTINLESQYLLIQGVPAVGAMKELVERFALYGAIEQYNALDEYPAEEFTEVYLIKFVKLQSARYVQVKQYPCPIFLLLSFWPRIFPKHTQLTQTLITLSLPACLLFVLWGFKTGFLV